MVYQPDDEDTVYNSLRNRLTGKIARLTNFVESSFNNVWTRAFASTLHEYQVALLATQLSSYIDYAGGPLTQEDLNALGIDDIDPDEINQYMEDEDLDELVKVVGISRDPGEHATGEIEITTESAQTDIPSGTEFGTEPDSDGDFLAYTTTAATSTTNGETTTTAPVEANEVGATYNVGSGQITYMPDPPSGVISVTNPESTTGGVDEETNDQLRSRAKNALVNQSGGGTVAGIEGFVEQNVDGVSSVFIDEFPQGGSRQSAPYSDVIVDGGDDPAVEEAIDNSRPTAINHFLVRPDSFTVGVEADVTGSDISTSNVLQNVRDHIARQAISDDVYRDKIIQIIMNSDSDIQNIDLLNILIEDEKNTFSNGTFVYSTEQELNDDDEDGRETGIREVTGTFRGTADTTFTENVDYVEWNSSAGDTSKPHDSVNFGRPLFTGAVAEDGGSQSVETTEANDSTTNDMTLLPSASNASAGDAYYFGDDNQFDAMDLNVSTAGDGTWTIVWEYYDGSSWTPLSNVTDDTNGFQTGGKNTINWNIPGDWQTTTVGGIADTYWVRARLDSISGMNTQPLGERAHLGKEPDDSTTFEMTYEIEEDVVVADREKADPGNIDITVV